MAERFYREGGRVTGGYRTHNTGKRSSKAVTDILEVGTGDEENGGFEKQRKRENIGDKSVELKGSL